MSDYDEIETLAELVRVVSDVRTGGYEAELDIKPNLEKARAGDGFFLVVEATSNWEGFPSGEYWFWDDDTVMQVL